MTGLQHLSSMSCLDPCAAILQWRLAEPAAEAPREMTRIREPAAGRDFCHGQIVQTSVFQQVARTPQAQFHEALDEGRAGPGECVVHSAGRNSELTGDAQR